MTAFFVKPLTLWPEAKARYILERLVEHEAAWNDYQIARRDIAIAYLSDPLAVLWEVWAVGQEQASQPAGMIGFTHVQLGINAKMHPFFFDGMLRDKKAVVRETMRWAFDSLFLHRISIEIPSDAFALVDLARKHLGFRFEGEGRILRERIKRKPGARAPDSLPATFTPNAKQASWGSRHFEAVRRHGQWLDLLLLSVTADEFQAFLETLNERPGKFLS